MDTQAADGDPLGDMDLTEHDIRRWVGEASFGRGLSYYRGGHILQPSRQGNTLHARCAGSEAQPYRLWVTLDERGIVRGNCICYVGAGGRCKHVAALLLTWLHAPERFAEQETRQATLEQRSKAELIALIERMLARHPDLESLIDTPLPLDTEHLPPVDEKAIRKQVQSAFYGSGDWGPTNAVPEELEQVVRLGDAYAAQDRPVEAVQVYQAVIDAVLGFYSYVQDGRWELAPMVDESVDGLQACLEKTEDPAQREVMLHALFEVFCWDVEQGGLEIGDAASLWLVEHARPDEKTQIAGWVRGAMPPAQKAEEDWSASYRRGVYGGLLLDLVEDEDDEAFFRICRETGRWRDLAQRLIELGRIEDATEVAREQDETVLLYAADRLVEAGQGDLAESLVRERAERSGGWRLPGWLKKHALARGDLNGAWAIAERQFWQRPNQGGYQELRDLGQQLGGWEARRGRILARLGDEGQHALLTEIHLQEGEPDRALEALGPVLSSSGGGGELALRVAEAVADARPRAALTLYRQGAERAIRGRNRPSYANAAHLLARVRALYRALGEPEAWQAYIADLRQEHRRLRALQDELNKAGITWTTDDRR
jgi:uncharacterized Zn finger protein